MAGCADFSSQDDADGDRCGAEAIWGELLMAETIFPPYLTFGEAQMYSRIPRRTLRELLASGEIPSRRFPGKVVIAKEAIDRYMAEETTLPDSLLRRTSPGR